MSDTISTPARRLALFARKPCSLEDACFSGKPELIEIQDRREMTEAEYDTFSRSMSQSRAWLEGKGGYANGRVLVVEVSAPGRKTLYINPEGGDWARFAGIAW